MKSDAEIINEYVMAMESISALFGPNLDQPVRHEDFKIAMREAVVATTEYIEHLKSSNRAVPVGLEESNDRNRKYYL
mgnify:CR=1 FL=1